MIILDTNVFSEGMKGTLADAAVWRWFQQVHEPLWITAMTVSEVLFGITRLPQGRRRKELESQADALFHEFTDSILVFDETAARTHVEILLLRQRRGRPISTVDSQIAAICKTQGASLATRSVRDFAYTGIDVINPWKP